MVNDEEMIVKSADYLVTETELNRTATSEEISAFMRRQRLSGVAEIGLREGGSRGVRVIQRTKLSDEEAVKVREILDMKTV